MAKKASENVKYYKNSNGPVIGTVSRKVIEKDGLYFKDLDGSGDFKPYDDWRLPAEERARAYVKALTTDEKIAQLFISDWRMGKYLSQFPDHQPQLDESGTLDDAEFIGKTIFGEQHLPGTTELIKKWFARHLILRANPTPEDLADWLNQLHAVAEECEHFVPVQVVSNSRNENGELVFGMNDAAGIFAAWPGTLGIAAAVKGDSIDLVDDFADCVRREWDATGLKKGYMYMADVVSDPRWQRTYGTFGEDPQLICEIFRHIIPRIQGSEEGVTADGVAMTVKHFPGGGARENGFDPHYQMGQWNVYQTEGSLEKYHIPGFQVVVDCNASSIMPYYAKPAAAKSAPQTDKNGDPMEMQPYGFAYNKPFIDGLLRRQMGFRGYINSDTGIVHNMSWGVEMLDKPERIGFAVNNAGVDLISGLFENPYRDPKKAAEVIADPSDWDKAMDVHRKSVVLLKNDGVLPLTADKLAGKKVYAECFNKNPEAARAATESLRQQLQGTAELTEDYREADYAVLLLNPSSGEYFNATPGYLELDLCDGKEVPNVDNEGRPTEETHKETTLAEVGRIAEIAEAVHAKGGKVIANVNVTLAWEVGNVEPSCDAFLCGFDTYVSAVLDVIFGRFSPAESSPLRFREGMRCWR